MVRFLVSHTYVYYVYSFTNWLGVNVIYADDGKMILIFCKPTEFWMILESTGSKNQDHSHLQTIKYLKNKKNSNNKYVFFSL